MDSQDLQKLREQISASRLLSQIEKIEWVQLLSEMNDTQAAELQSILKSAETSGSSAVSTQPVTPTTTPAAPAPAIPRADEKQLPAGAGLAALEQAITPALPERPAESVVVPATPVSTTVPAQTQPLQTPPVVQVPQAPIVHDRPAWQKSIFEHITSNPTAGLPETPAPAAAAGLVTPVVEAPAQTPVAPKKTPMLDVRKPEDLEKVNLAFLRQGDPQLILNNLLHAVTEMTKTYPITQILGKIEQSPLYHVYYDTGFSALNSGALAVEPQANTFSKEEFEAFVDFRHEMEHILS